MNDDNGIIPMRFIIITVLLVFAVFVLWRAQRRVLISASDFGRIYEVPMDDGKDLIIIMASDTTFRPRQLQNNIHFDANVVYIIGDRYDYEMCLSFNLACIKRRFDIMDARIMAKRYDGYAMILNGALAPVRRLRPSELFYSGVIDITCGENMMWFEAYDNRLEEGESIRIDCEDAFVAW